MKRELNKEEIDQLFDFTRKHYMEYYDVQVELVDHLASAVEEQWEEQPSLSFDEALNHVFSGFGIFGFDGIETERGSAVRKQQAKLWRKTLFNLFKWPNAALSFLIYILFYQLFKYFPHDFLAQSLSVIITATSIILLIIESISVKRTLKKKLMLLQQRAFYIGFCYIPAYINQFLGFWMYNQKPWLLALIFSIIALMLYAYTITSKKIMTLAKNQYPEAFKGFVNN